MSNAVTLSLEGSVATLVVNRPEALNAINGAVIEALASHVRTLERSREVQVVVLTGAGDKAFVAGADIKEMLSFDPEQAAHFGQLGARVFSALGNLPQVVIARVHGFALGGGLELALSADFIVASSKAKFGLPEVTLGLIPGFGGTQRLAERIGAARALEWVTSAERYDAQEAFAVGLVNRVVAPEELDATVAALAKKISSNGPGAVRAVKAVVANSQRVNAGVGFELEAARFGLRFGTPEAKEGLAAFVEKRPPAFLRQ
ncbi:MAG: enoyl-CoA hydratase/isomerase family protein [Silvanigrellales bacterium]|nr:enoyl-CoA hydratase/isomerase family protein [Silvanigrellales bacterium]